MNENIFSEYLTIVFSNNGKPFPKGMSESYCIRGEKAGETANEGIGTWKVCQIVKDHFKGEIKVIDNPLDEYPVRIEIKLPIIGWSDEK
jgi:type I restriction enzyme M protein